MSAYAAYNNGAGRLPPSWVKALADLFAEGGRQLAENARDRAPISALARVFARRSNRSSQIPVIWPYRTVSRRSPCCWNTTRRTRR